MGHDEFHNDDDDGEGLGSGGGGLGGGSGPPSQASEDSGTGTASTSPGDASGDTDYLLKEPVRPPWGGGGSGYGGGGSGGRSGTVQVLDDEPILSDEVDTSAIVSQDTIDAAVAEEAYQSMLADETAAAGAQARYAEAVSVITETSGEMIDRLQKEAALIADGTLNAIAITCPDQSGPIPDPIAGGTHYLYLEGDSTTVYSNYRLRQNPSAGTITDTTRVYLHPKEEYIGKACAWCKITPIEGDLSGVDVYIKRSNLIPLLGTIGSLDIVCPTSQPDPSGFIPNWVMRGACAPFYDPSTMKYCATVVTSHTTIDEGSSTTTSENIKSEVIPQGIKQILEYFSRRPSGYDDAMSASEYLIANSYSFAETEKLYLSPRPNAKVKALVTIDSKYLHAIPKRVVPAIAPKNGIRSVIFNSHNLQEEIDLSVSTLNDIESKKSTFTGTIVDFSPSKEARMLSKVPSALKELLRTNGADLRTTHEDLVEITVDSSFSPVQITLYQEGTGRTMDVGLNSFIASTGVNRARTMHYLLQTHNMNSSVRSQRFKSTPFNWLEHCTNYTYPSLEVRFTSKLTPGINTEKLQADMKNMIDKFNSMPFKGPEQLKFEGAQLTSPAFLKNMSLARADFELPSGDNLLANLPELLDEIGSMDDLFGKFLGKVEIPSLIQMAMASIMEQLEFPDLFEALVGSILGKLSLEAITDQILGELDADVRAVIIEDFLTDLGIPTEVCLSILGSLGILTLDCSTAVSTATWPGMPYLKEAIPSDQIPAALREYIEFDATVAETEGKLDDFTEAAVCAGLSALSPEDLIKPIVHLAVHGAPQVNLPATDLNLEVDINGESPEISGLDPTPESAGTSLPHGGLSGPGLPSISAPKIMRSMFSVCKLELNLTTPSIIASLGSLIKAQISLGAIDIPTFKQLPVISANLDQLLGDPNLNLNMEIPSLPGVSLEMPSLNVDMPSLSVGSLNIPTITLPDNIPTDDLMGLVFDGMQDAVKSGIESALVAMAKSVIEGLIGDPSIGLGDLSFGEASIEDLLASSIGTFAAAEETISQVFTPLGIEPDGSTDATDEEIIEALDSCGSSEVTEVEKGTPSEFLGAVSSAVTLPELKKLLEGRPTPETCETIQAVVASGFHNFAPALENCSQIEEVFGKIGESVEIKLIEQEIPEKRRLVNKLDYLCGVIWENNNIPTPDDAYKQTMANKGLSNDETEAQLSAMKERKKAALEELAGILSDIQSDSVLDGVVPPVYPEDCSQPSLMPPDSEIPAMNFANDMAMDAIYSGIEMAWITETSMYHHNMLSSTEVGEVVPLIYPGGSRNEINPKFTTLYSSGHALCDSNAVIYTEADDLAAAKLIINAKNPAKRPERVLMRALANNGDDDSDYEGTFLDATPTFSSWFPFTTTNSDGDEVKKYILGEDYRLSAAADRSAIANEVNVLQSVVSSSISKDITERYENLSHSTNYSWLYGTDPDTDPMTIVVEEESIGAVTMTIPHVTASTAPSDTSAEIDFSLDTEDSCVTSANVAISVSSSVEVSATFYPGAPKQAQVLTQMAYSSYLSNNLVSSDMEGEPVIPYALGTSRALFEPYTSSEEIRLSEGGAYFYTLGIAEALNHMVNTVNDSSIMTKEAIEALNIETSAATCDSDPPTVLDPAAAKKDAMDSLNSSCPSPVKEQESGRSVVRQAGIAGLIGLTLRAYIADVLLRAIYALQKLPLSDPSELMVGYIYEDMISDMQSIDSDYYANFFSEAVRIYSERDEAIAGLSDRDIFSILIKEQFAPTAAALSTNLGAEYSDLDLWFLNTWPHKQSIPTDLSNPGSWADLTHSPTAPDGHTTHAGLSGDGYMVIETNGNQKVDIVIYKHSVPTSILQVSPSDYPDKIRLVLASAESRSTTSKNELFKLLIKTEEYQTIFGYCIPLRDLASMVHLSLAMNVSQTVPAVQQSFDGTKYAIRELFDILFYGDQQGVEYTGTQSGIDAMANAENNVGSDPETFSDGTPMAKMMAKMAIQTVPTMIKGLAEKLDPNIKRSKLIRDAALKVGETIHPINASLKALPMNIIPPPFGGIGPPITPLGLAYWVLASPDKIEKRKAKEAGSNPGVGSATSDTGGESSNEECNPNEEETS